MITLRQYNISHCWSFIFAVFYASNKWSCDKYEQREVSTNSLGSF